MRSLLLRMAAVSLLVTLALAAGPASVARVNADHPVQTSLGHWLGTSSAMPSEASGQGLQPQPAPVRTPDATDWVPRPKATVPPPRLAPLAGPVPVPVPEPSR